MISGATPADRLSAFLAACGGAVRQSGRETVFRCPCHARHANGDANPSGNVRLGDDGRLLVVCRAGCPTADVLAVIGWKEADLMPLGPGNGWRPPGASQATLKRYGSAREAAVALARSRGGELVEYYVYTRDGRDHGLVARVRLPSGRKEMPQARCEGGGWMARGMIKPIPLFNGDTLAGSAAVQLHEGEKKASLATKLGFVAVSCAMGAGKATHTDLTPLSGRTVHLFADNDEPGRRHVEDLAQRANAVGAAQVWKVTLPNLPEGGDIVDFFEARRAAGASDEQIADEIREAVARAEDLHGGVTCEPGRPAAVDRHRDDPPAPVPFPTESLPASLRAIVVEGAVAHEVDPAFFGVPLLAIAAGAIGASRHIVVRPTWREPSILWAANVAISGSGKSAPMDVLLAPLREYDEELLRQTTAAHERFRNEYAAWNKAQRRADAEETGSAPQEPPILSALLDDITMETIAPRAVDNPRLLMAIDELATWLAGFDRYRGGRGADEAHWLRFYGGRPTKVERRRGLPIYVARPHVSICGGIQPRVLARLLDRPKRESGLAARLLLAAPPVRAPVWTTATISSASVAAYRSVVRSFTDLQLHEPPLGLPLTPEAGDLFRTAATRLGIEGFEMASGGDEDLGAAYQKLRSAVPRIALALALARAAENGTAELLRSVDANAMAGAIAIGDYFAAQARRIYARWQAEGGDPLVARILAVVRDAGPLGASRTDIRDALGRNAAGEQIDAALAVLAPQRLIARAPAAPSVGRPAERWRAIG